ncbi:thiamine-phosphate kinase [Candidatus Peregrinibacteria bacterium RIFOXYC2_FULL_33_13]|nr:MAG: thiamine-monophosphate kinase, thiamine-monophosphate kinase [Candidatus Peregrinibacteria bacterium GW2011_GWC2_33_13]OGJ53175.1 MAG: thiamine-phosphate kinase [Candidatus Peregrinibacteria bacterium RIFOXYC2_FULL_33_13]
MGEFDIIDKIRREILINDPKVIKGIGDDCAVIDRGDFFELVGTDMLVENDHFHLHWSTPEQIGIKAMNSNISDVAAMGGRVKYAFISICVSESVDEEWISRVYDSFNIISKDNDFLILGGDITHGENVIINICLIGEVERNLCCFRHGAKINDIICVTGNLGGSAAGLYLLQNSPFLRNLVRVKENYRMNSIIEEAEELQIEEELYKKGMLYALNKHIEPSCRIIEGKIIAKFANSLIDVSDGLGSEIRHIIEESGKGARIYANQVPINKMLYDVSRDPMPFAMSGGEDFELVFTIAREKIPLLKEQLVEIGTEIFEVGKIVEESEGVKFIENGREVEMPRGFEHL